MTHLSHHATSRGAPKGGQLLRYTNGKPITTRRYDHLWIRIGKHVPWVATQQVTAHWLRHTTLTWVERTFGFAVAREFAGHAESSSDAGTTATYVRATLEEIATVVAVLTGEPHPLGRQP
jgi:integrase